MRKDDDRPSLPSFEAMDDFALVTRIESARESL
jgi:hypothetical protein